MTYDAVNNKIGKPSASKLNKPTPGVLRCLHDSIATNTVHQMLKSAPVTMTAPSSGRKMCACRIACITSTNPGSGVQKAI